MITAYAHNEQIRHEPFVSIRPDKAVFRLVKSVYRKKSSVSGDVWVRVPKYKRSQAITEKPKVERKFHNFQMKYFTDFLCFGNLQLETLNKWNEESSKAKILYFDFDYHGK